MLFGIKQLLQESSSEEKKAGAEREKMFSRPGFQTVLRIAQVSFNAHGVHLQHLFRLLETEE